MRLNTRHFGEIDIEQDATITFFGGLPGFFNLTRFVLLYSKDGKAHCARHCDMSGTFLWLQSLEDSTVCFMLLNMFLFSQDFAPIIQQDDLDQLGASSPEGTIIRNIATMGSSLETSTINLLAPIVINLHTRRGAQVLCTNKNYHIRHSFLLSPLTNTCFMA